MISVTEAAARLKCTRANVIHHIQTGRIKAEKIGTYYGIEEAELEKLKNLKPGPDRKFCPIPNSSHKIK